MKHRLSWVLSTIHLTLCLVVVLYVNLSSDGQVSLLWMLLGIIDFPISLLYFLAGNQYSTWLDGIGNPVIAQIFYFPHLIHLILGTIWWWVLPFIFQGIFKEEQN
jgi:heme/copper-type cytochrome/quinol oxidase subunit 4